MPTPLFGRSLTELAVTTAEQAAPTHHQRVGSPAPVVQVITEWRHTAEVHADPELFAAITQHGEDHGTVPAPPAL